LVRAVPLRLAILDWRAPASAAWIRPRPSARTALLILGFLVGGAAFPSPALAVLDVHDRGPMLNAGRVALRVTNAGILGNAFFGVGLSSDPSLEFPTQSGRELLNYAALWVGARTEHEGNRVSGGPILEWRPTPDPEDRVRTVWHGRLGTRSLVDDDADGRIDEETLNGRDDDGDGEVDEDLGLTSQQMLAADYVDDRPEALYYIYEGSESHRPLHLSVHQEVYGWTMPGYDNIAGLQFRITNHGTETLRDLQVGLFADLDVRLRSDRVGHLNDRPIQASFGRTINDGCVWRLQRPALVMTDRGVGDASSRAASADARGVERERVAPRAKVEGLVRLLGMNKVVDRSEIRPGETVGYRIGLWNFIGFPLPYTFCVEDEIPTGFRYVSGSARLDDAPISDPAGTTTLVFSFEGMPAFIDRNGNGVADPDESGYRSLTYRLEVPPSVGEGSYFNVAVACTGSVQRSSVSDEAHVVVRVVASASSLPVITLVPLDHTIDPLALIPPARAYARTPERVAFRTTVFERNRAPGQGGVPTYDADRYAAMAGTYPSANTDEPGDYVVLLSCGPFTSLAPGQSIDFAAAFVAAEQVDSLAAAVANAMYVHHGTTANLLPDSTGPNPSAWFEGKSGINGHEVCLDAPEGVTFLWDPHCPGKFGDNAPPAMSEVYRHGTCVWTDADCQACTGSGGRETVVRWLDPGTVPPPPGVRIVPLDHAIRVEWDNRPEVLLAAGMSGPAGTQFAGYNIYRISDWRSRVSLLPTSESWSLLATIGPDSSHGQIPLTVVTDSSIDYESILFRRRLYPPGHYRFTDTRVKNGFDYVYAVSTISEIRAADGSLIRRLESPLPARFDDRVSPRAASRERSGEVWVVPNPFRANAAWDRPAVFGDPLTRHIDFMGLPRARCTVKIWTLAGDLVAELDHDGSGGDGQAAWNLTSRSGQDIESGVYLFTVDSPLGHQIGRFVVIR
jgi:uncharacterized repeat protein (TIGR01451 family)